MRICQNIEDNKNNAFPFCSNTSNQDDKISNFDIKNIDTNKSIHKENLYEDLCMKDETNTGVDINSWKRMLVKTQKI